MLKMLQRLSVYKTIGPMESEYTKWEDCLDFSWKVIETRGHIGT